MVRAFRLELAVMEKNMSKISKVLLAQTLSVLMTGGKCCRPGSIGELVSAMALDWWRCI